MKILEKLICKHKWDSHDKQKREFYYEFEPGVKTARRVYTREVLICDKCGKIKQIEY